MLTYFSIGCLIGGVLGFIDGMLVIRSRCGQRFSFWQKMIPLSGFYAYWLDHRETEAERLERMDAFIRKSREQTSEAIERMKARMESDAAIRKAQEK